jgi:hypothetical protein
MVSNAKLSALAVLIAALLYVGPAHATSAAVKCQEQKLTAQGKYELCGIDTANPGRPSARVRCRAKGRQDGPNHNPWGVCRAGALRRGKR